MSCEERIYQLPYTKKIENETDFYKYMSGLYDMKQVGAFHSSVWYSSFPALNPQSEMKHISSEYLYTTLDSLGNVLRHQNNLHCILVCAEFNSELYINFRPCDIFRAQPDGMFTKR